MEIIKNNLLSEEIYHEKLPNNMDVFFMPKPGFNKKYAIFATDYGSNDLEFINPHTKEKTRVNEGIAHFLEHKMFEQPEGDDALLEFSKYGASANAFTNFDMTAYIFSATENFYQSLEHLISFVQTPHFTDQNVEKEKGIIAQEIKMYEDNAEWRVFFNALKALYSNHHNSIDIAGTVESIYKITKEELYNCYNTFYSPSNMALFVIGDLDYDKVMETVKTTVSDKNMFEGKIQRIEPVEPEEIAHKKIEENMEISMPMFTLGYKDIPLENPEENIKRDMEMTIAMDIMFGKASKLHEKLYSEGLIYNQLSYEFNYHRTYAYSLISAETRDVQKVCDEIQKTIENFKENGITEKDFQRVRKSKIGAYIKLFDSIEGIANQYLSMHFIGINLFKIYDILNEINIDDINNRIKSHFKQEKNILSVINPKK